MKKCPYCAELIQNDAIVCRYCRSRLGTSAEPSSRVTRAAPTTVVVQPGKSVGWAIILGLFFGPLGMLYSTIIGSILMGIVWVVVLISTLGFGLLIIHPICAIWAALAAQAYNRRQFESAIRE